MNYNIWLAMFHREHVALAGTKWYNGEKDDFMLII